MDSREQSPQENDLSTEDADIRWEEEQAELEYYEKKFGLSDPTPSYHRKPYLEPRPMNEQLRFKMHRAQIQALSEIVELDNVWETTYTAARFENIFLKESLHPFYTQDQIVDVIAQVKGGKEANVYLCKAHPSTGVEWIAAKVYRPRQFRNLRNDAMYREGRHLLAAEDGRPQAIKRRDERVARAVKKNTTFGAQVRHTSWLMYEFSALQIMHAAGVPVPNPYGVGENAILMEYIGDEKLAAPTLHEVHLEQHESGPLFERTLESMAVMLHEGIVHGDLSAYNILYWQGEIKLIDFPQVMYTQGNPSAQSVFNRDVKRICQYFGRYGIQANANLLAEELWDLHTAQDPDDLLADLSRVDSGEDGESDTTEEE